MSLFSGASLKDDDISDDDEIIPETDSDKDISCIDTG